MFRFAFALALLVGSLAAFALAACGVSVETDGPHTVQTRTVASFHRVEVHGSATVVVRRGTGHTLTVEGGKHRVHDLVTRVESGTLFVDTRDSSATIDIGGADVTVTVQTPSLTAVRIDGSGDLHLADLAARDARLDISGSGDADVPAERTLDVALQGSGDVSYSGDPKVTKSVRGSGDASHRD